MSFPENTYLGAGTCRFFLFGTTGGGNRVIDLTDVFDVEIVADPINIAGGKPEVTLDDGTIIDRTDGYRFTFNLSGQCVDADDVASIVEIVNFIKIGGKVVIQPHNDVNFKASCFVSGSLSVKATANLYMGHDVDVTFKAIYPFAILPVESASGTAQMLMELLNSVG